MLSPICLSLLLLLLLTDFCTVHFHMKGPNNKAWSWALIFCTLFLPHIPKTWLQPLQGEPNPGLREPFLLARFIILTCHFPLYSSFFLHRTHSHNLQCHSSIRGEAMRHRRHCQQRQQSQARGKEASVINTNRLKISWMQQIITRCLESTKMRLSKKYGEHILG